MEQKETDANGQELDFRERNLDVSRNDEALVQNAVKDFYQSGRARVTFDG